MQATALFFKRRRAFRKGHFLIFKIFQNGSKWTYAQFQTFDIISPVISLKQRPPLRLAWPNWGHRQPVFACSMVSSKLPRKLLSEGISRVEGTMGTICIAFHFATSIFFNFPIPWGKPLITFGYFGSHLKPTGWFKPPWQCEIVPGGVFMMFATPHLAKSGALAC